jgi:hypothetical protein
MTIRIADSKMNFNVAFNCFPSVVAILYMIGIAFNSLFPHATLHAALYFESAKYSHLMLECSKGLSLPEITY